MNRLEEWHRRGVVEILMSEPAATEAARGHDDIRTKKVQGYIQTLTEIETDEEQTMKERIRIAIFPDGAKDETQENDVAIVFNSNKYGAILVTNDGDSKRQAGGILGARNQLAQIGVRVVTDEDACKMVKDRILARDDRARQEAKETGSPLPTWVGADDLPEECPVNHTRD